jgi:hypothetical protein
MKSWLDIVLSMRDRNLPRSRIFTARTERHISQRRPLTTASSLLEALFGVEKPTTFDWTAVLLLEALCRSPLGARATTKSVQLVKNNMMLKRTLLLKITECVQR